MKYIIAFLSIGVVLRHSAHNYLPGMNHYAWFYVLGGAWEASLCGIIFAMLYVAKRDRWIRLGMAACAIGALEGLQMSLCRLALWSTRPSANVCDQVTGLPVGAVAMSLYILIICWVVIRK